MLSIGDHIRGSFYGFSKFKDAGRSGEVRAAMRLRLVYSIF